MLKYSMVPLLLVMVVAVLGFEYTINYERLELVYYDKSLLKDAYFLFRKYNRTNFCLNTSFILNQDIDGRNLKFTTSAFQLLSNQYKHLGLELKYNVCEYWRKNIHGVTNLVKQYGNLDGCNTKKDTLYYLYNFMPDEDNFPKYVPLGGYMIQMDVVWKNETPLIKFEWHVTSKLKIGNRIYGLK